jgi:hypothetical protein
MNADQRRLKRTEKNWLSVFISVDPRLRMVSWDFQHPVKSADARASLGGANPEIGVPRGG